MAIARVLRQGPNEGKEEGWRDRVRREQDSYLETRQRLRAGRNKDIVNTFFQAVDPSLNLAGGVLRERETAHHDVGVNHFSR